VPISLRAAALRAALERALNEPVHLLTVDGATRISAPAPPADADSWPAVMTALRSADRWGSDNTTGAPEVWAEVDDEVSE
jgi:hypothetical protein